MPSVQQNQNEKKEDKELNYSNEETAIITSNFKSSIVIYILHQNMC